MDLLPSKIRKVFGVSNLAPVLEPKGAHPMPTRARVLVQPHRHAALCRDVRGWLAVGADLFLGGCPRMTRAASALGYRKRGDERS